MAILFLQKSSPNPPLDFEVRTVMFDILEIQKITESPVVLIIFSVEAGFPARESIPLEAFYAVDEYKSILGETWTLPFVPGAESEQERMIESIAVKHGITKNDFAQAFRYKVNDEGIE